MDTFQPNAKESLLLMLCRLQACSNANLGTVEKFFFPMWRLPLTSPKCLAKSENADFRGPYTHTSSGWSTWVACAGRHATSIWFARQKSTTLAPT